MPLELSAGWLVLVNKNAIVMVSPFDEERMGQSYKMAPIEPPAPASSKKKSSFRS